MAGRLKLLQFTQKTYSNIGIYPSQSNQNGLPINWFNIFMMLSFIQMATFSLAFLLFEADDIVDAGALLFCREFGNFLCNLLFDQHVENAKNSQIDRKL